jgi:Domain of unknown function DUF11
MIQSTNDDRRSADRSLHRAGDSLHQLSSGGPDMANAVQVTFGAPADVIVYNIPANCVQTASIDCNLGSVGTGAAAEVRLVGTPQYPLPIAVTATVRSSTADPATSNDTASASTTVRR